MFPSLLRFQVIDQGAELSLNKGFSFGHYDQEICSDYAVLTVLEIYCLTTAIEKPMIRAFISFEYLFVHYFFAGINSTDTKTRETCSAAKKCHCQTGSQWYTFTADLQE